MPLPLAVWLLLCGVYLLTLSGHTYSADEETMYAVTRGLIESGRVAVTVENNAPLAALRPGRDGLAYSPYGVLPSLLALPLYGLGALAAIGVDVPGAQDYLTRLAISLLNGPLTAATAALLAAWALRLGVGRRWAIGLALAYGVGSFAWPYARTFFSEPLAALLILLAAERADAAFVRPTVRSLSAEQATPTVRQPDRSALFISGLASGLLLPTRIAAGIALPVVGLFICWRFWQEWFQRTDRTLRSASAYMVAAALYLAGLLPGLLLIAWYNLARFGTIFASGYASETGLFTTPLLEGLLGLAISPGKGVFWYAPALLLAFPGSLAFWRRGRRDLVILGWALFLSHMLLYARWGEWEGGGVWGPRFLLPVIAPLLLLGAGVAALEMRRLRRGIALALGLLGVVGNLGAILLNFNTYIVMPGEIDRLYGVSGSPLVGHWRVLLDRWSNYRVAPPYCAVGDGWYPSEDPAGTILPRRSGAAAAISCAEVQRLRFSLDDRRPPEAPGSELRLALNGRDLGPLPAGQLRRYAILLPERAMLTVAATTWNPLAVGFSLRADDLGPQLGALRAVTSSGVAAQLHDRAIAPLPTEPRARWAWYYDPPNQHLADLWFWYLPRSEIAGTRAWIVAGMIVVGGLGLMAAGLRALRKGAS
ncbi:MAG: hypothetical protein HC822_08695 [Oscillochloris sp.]|nr:hypothetical protein [Oscillochloris sp.]